MEVAADLDLKLCLTLSRQWLRECKLQHTQCMSKGPYTLPTRVLDIGDETAPSPCGEYVALSYCWGKIGNLTTAKDTLTHRRSGIPCEEMPRSFQEAVEITRGLEVRYLCIDALCIIQDDVSDWKRVCKNGRGYMRESIYTIRHEDIILPRSHYDITYPLMNRAWTLQERLLSRRIPHATIPELILECKNTLCCECGTIARGLEYIGGSSPKISYDKVMCDIVEEGERSLHTDIPHQGEQQKKPQIPNTSRAWTLFVGDYSNRMLTYESDKLPAVSALAWRFSLTDELPTARLYLAGLLLEDLPWLLCWRAYGRRFEKRPDAYCGPSWSWVSTSTLAIHAKGGKFRHSVLQEHFYSMLAAW
ncbi:hypothetical protein F4818DRAFT_437855 [Hypoxylon cercidicola]|nr:hypothetical protein F4818DRAFT_437855 [Hypoxylon cercidicola]